MRMELNSLDPGCSPWISWNVTVLNCQQCRRTRFTRHRIYHSRMTGTIYVSWMFFKLWIVATFVPHLFHRKSPSSWHPLSSKFIRGYGWLFHNSMNQTTNLKQHYLFQISCLVIVTLPISFSPYYADFWPSLPIFQSHISTKSEHKFCETFPWNDNMHLELPQREEEGNSSPQTYLEPYLIFILLSKFLILP